MTTRPKTSRTRKPTPPRDHGSLDPLVRHPGLYRAQLFCMLGRDALEGTTKPPCDATPTEYALYNLLHAVEEIATAMMPNVTLTGGNDRQKGTHE